MMWCHWYQVIVKYHPSREKYVEGQCCIPHVCINFDARLMSCNYTRALMRGGWTSRVATFIQEVNFLMKLRTDTKNLFHRRLVQCYSCSLAGLLTFMIRDVFLLEPFTCAWKCEVPQAPACIRWRENSFLPKISTFMKTWDIVFRNDWG